MINFNQGGNVGTSDIEKIRPAGRHILTIGRDLIKDNQAAIIELVKNAYDADATNVDIYFEVSENNENIKIIIKDNGHGMTRDTVINKWLVPSTDDKLRRISSPNGRIMQGRKGVGRYAASILGQDILLKTIDTDGNQTEIYLEWTDFEKATYLDDVDILVATSQTNEFSGTEIIINGGKDEVKAWTFKNDKGKKNKYSENIDILITQLQKLVSPIKKIESKDNFIITTHIHGINGFYNSTEEIKTLPINDFYDYRLEGKTINKNTIKLTFSNQKVNNIPSETFTINTKNILDNGNIEFDIRVYDRDPQDIENLIKRGLKHVDGSYFGHNETRILLNELNGISIYRNNFRIRPYGEPGYDWLLLDKRRVDNPTMCIGSNQVIGYIYIESEEKSHLEEKSARDGLKENDYYLSFKSIIIDALKELETRRYNYRRQTNNKTDKEKIYESISSLADFEDVKKELKKHLSDIKINQEEQDKIISVIEKEEVKKSKIIDDINKKIAVYQGQATLGKIINVVLHEGRKPLNFFKNEITNAIFWLDELKKKQTEEILNEIIKILDKFEMNSKTLTDLFSRIDPLAAGKRGSKKEFYLKNVIEKSFSVYNEDLITKHIKYEISCEPNIKIYGWEADFYIILTNLIDNSIYWLCEKDDPIKRINVNVYNYETGYALDFIDNGPGINADFIESEVIFEPEFSLKTNGTGLGLALAGEASARNNYKLEAIENNDGAYLRLIPLDEVK